MIPTDARYRNGDTNPREHVPILGTVWQSSTVSCLQETG
jgi:hypothetical protein